MKKISCILLALLLLTALALPVLAVSGSVSLSVSQSALYRGDTFTVTASLSSSDAIALGTVKLSYDAGALELTGGSCHVAGASVGNVIAGSNAGTFMLSGDPAVISGTIFTFRFRVKDSAAFGSYTISSSASIGVDVGQSISSGSTTVTVACRHSYGSWSSAGEEGHSHSCTVCGQAETVSHTWDAGTVITPATCKVPGTKKLTCTDCGATTEAEIPLSSAHQYGQWSESSWGHSHTCTVCGISESADHTWNNGTVVTPATCQAVGSKYQTCTRCGASRTVTIPKTDHVYGQSTYVDAATHSHSCQLCGQGAITAHQYGSQWLHDENWHFLRCEGCGHEKDQAAHTPGPEATETTDQICTVCNRILKPMGKHVHHFSTQWTTDTTGHWHSCDSCNEKDSAAPHTFDDDCDSDCNICGMTREPAHLPAATLTADGSGHYYPCTVCGAKVDLAAHTPGPEATITSAQTCTLCGYELAPVLPHEHVFNSDGTTHSHSCACGQVYTAQADTCQVCATFPWKTVCIAEAAVLGAVILVLVILLARKKRRN